MYISDSSANKNEVLIAPRFFVKYMYEFNQYEL